MFNNKAITATGRASTAKASFFPNFLKASLIKYMLITAVIIHYLLNFTKLFGTIL